MADEAAHATAKADSVVQFLRDSTPAEAAQYVRTQVNADGITTLAQAKAAIKALETVAAKLAMIDSVLAKQQFR